MQNSIENIFWRGWFPRTLCVETSCSSLEFLYELHLHLKYTQNAYAFINIYVSMRWIWSKEKRKQKTQGGRICGFSHKNMNARVNFQSCHRLMVFYKNCHVNVLFFLPYINWKCLSLWGSLCFFIRTSKFCWGWLFLIFFNFWGWNVNLFLFPRLNLAMPQRMSD